MKYSFVVPCTDRISDLQSCIVSIEKAHKYVKSIEIEIVVVFNGGVDGSQHIKTEFSELVFFHTIKEMGASKARNYGCQKSTGDYLIFVDDDAVIKYDFLAILLTHLSDSLAQVFCGKILNILDQTPYTDVFRDNNKKYLKRMDYYYFMASAVVIKKEIFEKIGLFDEKFGPGAQYFTAEESDLFFRLIQSGEKILYLPDLVVFHPVLIETAPNKVFRYAYASGAMFAKQIFSDKAYSIVYLFFFSRTVLKSFIRSLQNIISPKSLMNKNKRFQYAAVFRGIIKGFIEYIHNEKIKPMFKEKR